MLVPNRQHRGASAKSYAQVGRYSRGDFIQALRALGATGVTNCPSLVGQPGTGEVHTGFLSCPRETWVRAFGEPENVDHREDPERHLPLDAWRCQCTDGPVTCVGRLFERWPGQEWVIVEKVALQRTPAGQPEVRGKFANEE